jgi:hypothetical protein
MSKHTWRPSARESNHPEAAPHQLMRSQKTGSYFVSIIRTSWGGYEAGIEIRGHWIMKQITDITEAFDFIIKRTITAKGQ